MTLPSPLDEPLDVIVVDPATDVAGLIVDFDKPHCLSCLRVRRLIRQLCNGCYERHRRGGTLGIYDRALVARDDVLTEYEHLRESRVPVREMPDRVGMTLVAFDRALMRARDAGDDRAASYRGPVTGGWAK